MSVQKRIAVLIAIMTAVVAVVESITIAILYRTAFEEERTRLIETAKSQARLIEAIGRFDVRYSADYPSGPRQATLDQIREAHMNYGGFGRTGEFTLSAKENDQIVFLLSHRHFDLTNPRPVPWKSNLAQPMRLALSGQSGTIVGLDYRGETVLAAYEPVAVLNLGIVSKIDLAEVREPFLKAGLLSILIAIVMIVGGAAISVRVTEPIIVRLSSTVERLETTLAELRTLRGILPICSFCKKIRDDKGYWDQVETYISQHTDVAFSHGICPDCLAEHYPEFNPRA